MNVIFSEYKGEAISEIDYEIYINRIGSACIVIKNKIYDRNKKELVEAPEGFYVADFFDDEFVNFRGEIIPDSGTGSRGKNDL